MITLVIIFNIEEAHSRFTPRINFGDEKLAHAANSSIYDP